jgi:hypothetical protein
MPIQEGGRFTPQDTIVSPGVFTRELDLSGITQGVADIVQQLLHHSQRALALLQH